MRQGMHRACIGVCVGYESGMHRGTDQVVTLSVELGEGGFSAGPYTRVSTHLRLFLGMTPRPECFLPDCHWENQLRLRSIRKLRIRKSRITDTKVLGNSIWTWEFHPF